MTDTLDFLQQHKGAVFAASLASLALAKLGWGGVQSALQTVRAAPRTFKHGLGTGGAAATETVIVVPILFLLIGAVVQLALVAEARLIVAHAAFKAARAAMVLVPQAPPCGAPGYDAANQIGSGGDTFGDFTSSCKMAQIRRAASSATAIVSPRGWQLGQRETSIGQSFGQVGLMSDKFGYADSFTSVVFVSGGTLSSRFGPRDTVQTRVRYLFYCQVPMAGRFAGMAFGALDAGARDELATSTTPVTPDGNGYYLVLTAEHQFVNQGA